jgi:3',5'-cyclic AMP phosphodiesterase CpdA
MHSQTPLYFIHMTDTHVKAPGAKPFLNLDTSGKLRAVFAAVRALSIQPAFFVISGDLTHEGDTEDYRHLRAVVDEEAAAFGVPVFVSLGNHDHRGPFREGYLGEGATENAYYYAEMIDGLRLIVLDSEISDEGEKVEGRLDAAQLAWLRTQLEIPAPRGTILVVHHPPLRNTLRLLDSHILTNPADLADAIRGRDVIGILSGHIHFNSIGSFEGIPSIACAGVAFNLDPTTSKSMRFIDSSGYNLVMVADGRMIVQPTLLPGAQTEAYHWHLGDSLAQAAGEDNAIPEALS